MRASVHEVYHILALGPALIETGISRAIYDDLRLLAYADEDSGGVCLADHPDLHHTVEARVLSLASIAPLASLPDIHRRVMLTHPGDLAVKLAASVAKVGLSDEDLAHASAFDGPPLAVPIVLRATALLADRLGLSGRLTLAKLVGGMSKADCEPPRLAAFAPYSHARKALDQARAELHQRKSA